MVYGLGQQPNNNVPYMGIKDVIPEGAQNIGAAAGETAKEAASSVASYSSANPLLQSAQGANENKGKAAAYFGGTAALFTAVNIWLNKVGGPLSKQWDKSLYGTLEKAGNGVIGKAIDRAIDNKGVINSLAKGLGRVKNVILNKLPFLTTPTECVWPSAKTQLAGVMSRSTNDYGAIISDILKGGKNIEGSIDLGAFGKALGQTFENTDAAEKFLKQIKDDPKKYKDAWISIVDFFKDKTDIVRHSPETQLTIPLLGIKIGKPFNMPKFIQRHTSGAQISNKIKSTLRLDNPEQVKKVFGEGSTRLGRFLPKAFSASLEGVTSGHAGWLLTFIMAAQFFSTTIRDTVEAPKGEKLTTFTDGLAKNIVPVGAAFLYCMPQNAVGGMKYMGIAKGLTEHQGAVGAWKTAYKAINEKIASGAFRNYAEYKGEVASALKLLKGDSKWWQKPFRAIGNFMSTGQEAIKPWSHTAHAMQNGEAVKQGLKFMDKLSGLKYKLQTNGGGIMRLVLGMLIVAPFIANIFTKLNSKIFGKTTKIKEEEAKKKADKEAKKLAKEQAKNAPKIDMESLAQRLMKHPELIAELEKDPQMMQQIAKNPQILALLLDEVEATVGANNPAATKPMLSPALQERLRNNPQVPQAPQVQQAPISQSAQQWQTPQPMQQPMQQNNMDATAKQPAPSVMSTPAKEQPQEPVRNYVPSSTPITLKNQTANGFEAKVNDAISRAERAEANAMKFLSF